MKAVWIVIAFYLGVWVYGAFGAACTESPTGQENCDQFTARDNNALPTPLPNYFRLKGNNAAGIAVPTPAAAECILGDTDATTSTDTFTLICNNGTNVKVLKLNAGQATAGMAPLYFTSGPLLPTPEPGAMEYLDHTAYFTTFQVRRSLMLNQAIVTSDVTVTNDATETTVYTIPMAANYLTTGKVIIPMLSGIYSAKNPHTFTLRLKYAGATVITITSDTGAATNLPWLADFTTTVRSIGAGGTAISSAHATFNAVDKSTAATGVTFINTTIANTMTVTVQWSNADPLDSFTLQQGYTNCVQ